MTGGFCPTVLRRQSTLSNIRPRPLGPVSKFGVVTVRPVVVGGILPVALVVAGGVLRLEEEVQSLEPT